MAVSEKPTRLLTKEQESILINIILKKRKLSLGEIKVESFITNLNEGTDELIKGKGIVPYTIGTCKTRDPQDCPPRDTNVTACFPCNTQVQQCSPSVVICFSNGAGGPGANC